ncbi:RE1 [Symbiodinium natans]|uniref:RE1 protein n=1 Tax=Symbiodinium natans TaxID=878477 RepID=A0A812JQX7_9DINO|nr:RE1 [Symbiodinium natans]
MSSSNPPDDMQSVHNLGPAGQQVMSPSAQGLALDGEDRGPDYGGEAAATGMDGGGPCGVLMNGVAGSRAQRVFSTYGSVVPPDSDVDTARIPGQTAASVSDATTADDTGPGAATNVGHTYTRNADVRIMTAPAATVQEMTTTTTVEQYAALPVAEVTMSSQTNHLGFSPPEELLDGSPRVAGANNGPVWIARLGEFLQRRVTQAGAILERTTRQTPTLSPPASWAQDPGRLFTPEAEQVMQSWNRRAPLLHGPVPPRDIESSSGSLTQEQILQEVQRQVQSAMRDHQEVHYGNCWKQEFLCGTRINLMVAAIWWDLQEILSIRSLRLPDLHEVVEWVLSLWVEAILLDYHDTLKLFRVKLVSNVYVQKSKQGIQRPLVYDSAYLKVILVCIKKGMNVERQDLNRGLLRVILLALDMEGSQGGQEFPRRLYVHQDNTVVKPGLVDLPRLAEASDTSAIDVGDWLHSLMNPMGDLSNSSSSWWHAILTSLEAYYQAYLRASTRDKLSLRPETFACAEVGDSKWSRVDKRAASMILASLPESVRGEVMAARLSGTLQILARVIVLYRPGGAAERQQVLKALESPTVASTPLEAVEALRRWSRWLRGLQPPDSSVLLKGLDMMVRKPITESSEISFRIGILRYNLEVDTKPCTATVKELHQALLSEFEQVAFKGRQMLHLWKQAACPERVSYTPQEPSEDNTDGCDIVQDHNYFFTWHLWRTSCFDNGGFLECPSTKYRANMMLRQMTQMNLKTLTLATVEREAACRTGLLDSGASHAYRIGSEEEFQAATKVQVQLADGKEVELRQTSTGTLLSPNDQTSPIVPLGELIESLDCTLEWTRDGMTIQHPQRGEIRPRMVANCPTVTEGQALELIRDIEEKKNQLVDATRSSAKLLWCWDKEQSWSQHLFDFLDTGSRTAQLRAMEAEDSPFKGLSASVRAALAEEVVLNVDAGAKYVKAMPISRRMRRTLLAAPWTLHLYAGAGNHGDLKSLGPMLEVDIQISKAYDLRKTAGTYRALLWSAAQGLLDGVVGAPPCRGTEDEELVAKQMWLMMVAKAARIKRTGFPVYLAMEGDRLLGELAKNEDGCLPNVAKIFTNYKDAMCLETLTPGVLTNLDMQLNDENKKANDGRWTATFKESLAQAVEQWKLRPEEVQRAKWMAKMDSNPDAFLKALSTKELAAWKTHIRNNHIPYNRRCRTCVEASGLGRMHKKVKTPSSYCLSLDILGPLRQRGEDPDHRDYRYMLVGAYLFPKLESFKKKEGQENPEPPPALDPAEEEGVDEGHRFHPVMEGKSVIGGVGVEDLVGEQGAISFDDMFAEEEEDLAPPPEEELPAGLSDEDFKKLFGEEVGDGNPEFQVLYVAHPLRTRTTNEIGAAVQEIYLKLRAEGQSPQSNGRAEAAVKWMKNQAKRLLLSTPVPRSCWTAAMTYSAWAQRERAMGRGADLLPFGSRVHLRSKVYGTGGKYDLNSRWKPGYYVGPSVDVRGGHVVRCDDGTYLTSQHLRPNLVDSDKLGGKPEFEAIVTEPVRRVVGKRKPNTMEEPQEEDVEHLVDPGHPAEEYARVLLEEEFLEKDQVEVLAGLLPMKTDAPKRFGETGEDGGWWSSGTFVHGGVAGVRSSSSAFPCTTRVLTKYLKQLQPDASFSAVALFINTQTKAHKDVHNLGMNIITPLSKFEGGGLLMEPAGEESYHLNVNEGTLQFDPKVKHSTLPWSGGDRLVLVGYHTRGVEKIKEEDRQRLHELGFPLRPITSSPPRIAKAQSSAPKTKGLGSPNDFRPLHSINEDLEMVLKDLDERATRLRDLLEEEEILAEEYRRCGDVTRETLNDTRNAVSKFLEETHEQIVEIERVRMLNCLRIASMATGNQEMAEVDYEQLLADLEGDLDVIHNVPLEQVKNVLSRWVEAIKEEVTALFNSGTIVKVSHQQAMDMESAGELKMAPAKCVFTLKPPKSKGGKYRRKCRTVICGNYVDPSNMSLYASGASTEALRVALVTAAMHHWDGATADIVTAFLLATWPGDMPKYGMRPPKVVRDAGAASDETWVIVRPLYGLRESPAIWSNFRNARLKAAKIKFGSLELTLTPTIAESELWLVRDSSKRLHGLVVTYVDDLFYFGNTPVIQCLHNFVKEEWPTSDLEWINENTAVRYLGVEVKKEGASYSISQQAYIMELLRAHDLQDALHTELPVPREWLEQVELQDPEPEDFSEEELRMGQRYVGEVSWLAMKTRPDIVFVVNHMATHVGRRPLHVTRLGKRLMSYLAATAGMRLRMAPRLDKPKELVCYTDASYAPYGSRSFGAAVIVQCGVPVAWKAGRQSFITMSVMEAELYAATQGCNLLDSIAAILDELAPGVYKRVLAIDNTSAAAMYRGGPGSQRTRHLKIRAHYLREATELGLLEIRHTPGVQQLADLATKMMTKVRLRQLLELWGFVGFRIAETLATLQLKILAAILTVISLFTPATGSSLEDEDLKEPIPTIHYLELMCITVMICASIIGCWEGAKLVYRWGLRQHRRAKKALKLEQVRNLVSRAAQTEVAIQATAADLDETPTIMMEAPSSRPATLRRRAASQSSPTTAHDGLSAFSDVPTEVRQDDADMRERLRVARDLLMLMTVEHLRQALRIQGQPTSGVKGDLAERLKNYFGAEEPPAGSMLPSTRQLRYVLYIWRHRNISGRHHLLWSEVCTRAEISKWIETWRHA